MSKIRAYKLAEELGLDRAEFVEKAAATGVELKSAMAQIEDDVAQDLREKLGSAKRDNMVVTERRVLATGGGAYRPELVGPALRRRASRPLLGQRIGQRIGNRPAPLRSDHPGPEIETLSVEFLYNDLP